MTASGSLAALIGDVVGSRRAADRDALQARIERGLAAVNARVGAAQPLTPTIGDEFQGLFHTVSDALDAVLRLRVATIGVAELRIGVGWGEIRSFDPDRAPFAQDGPCWWRARDALEEVARLERSKQAPASLRTMCRTGTQDESHLNVMLVLRDQILAAFDETDAAIMRMLMDGATQRDAAAAVGLHESSVSRRAQSHGLAAILHSRRLQTEPAG